jgi:hypothetical protein
MRYRSTNTMRELTQDYVSFLDLIGADEYRRLLDDVGKGPRNKGYVTPFHDIKFLLELQLPNFDLEYMRSGEQLTSIPQSLHEAVGFIYGIGQTIPHLTSNARNKLRGQIVGGLKLMASVRYSTSFELLQDCLT